MLSLLGCFAVMAAPASATELPETDLPLPQSTFQGGDGDQDDEGGFVDWQSLGGVRHRSDANDDDTAFHNSKELNPGHWDIRTINNGVGPPSDNVRDLWAAVDQPDPETFVYLAFTRGTATTGGGGSTFLAIELNRDGRAWDNGRAEIPCRRTDDLAITYETHGNVPEVNVRRWITDDADEVTSCARRGHFEDPVDVTPNVTAQGQLNTGAIASRLGGALSPSVPSQQFGEASLNLADIAETVFKDRCLAYSSVWMHSRASESEDAAMKDYVAPMALPVRSCTASGTKFWDANGNGVHELPSDRGLPRFKIWADYDNDGHHDLGVEPFDITDKDGQYVIFDIRGTYTLRETVVVGTRLRSVPLDWVCSAPTGTVPNGRFPCAWGPFDVAQDPNVQDRDFGNWFPAQLTLEKVLFPPTDPGRFDLLVDGNVQLADAGNGSRRTIGLAPGTYDISEQPAAGTDPADYLPPVVDCQSNVSRRGAHRSSAVFEDLTLVAGARATCTFTNVRRGEPAIAIRKSGPAQANAGATLRYTLLVSNPGEIPIPAATVEVTDPACDGAPELVEKRDSSGPDSTPETLDPAVDEWEYACARKTAQPGSDCETRSVDNTGTVTGTAEGKQVTASDTITTILRCPDTPSPPDPVPPDPPGPEPPHPPDVPGPVAPPGPTPPEAGVAGRASFLLRRATRRCLGTRVPRMNFRGTRIARISVRADGQLRRGITVRALQRKVTPRVTLAPGRHRITVRVVFQHGSGTPSVTLSRVVRVCARQAAARGPRFTG